MPDTEVVTGWIGGVAAVLTAVGLVWRRVFPASQSGLSAEDTQPMTPSPAPASAMVGRSQIATESSLAHLEQRLLEAIEQRLKIALGAAEGRILDAAASQRRAEISRVIDEVHDWRRVAGERLDRIVEAIDEVLKNTPTPYSRRNADEILAAILASMNNLARAAAEAKKAP